MGGPADANGDAKKAAVLLPPEEEGEPAPAPCCCCCCLLNDEEGSSGEGRGEGRANDELAALFAVDGVEVEMESLGELAPDWGGERRSWGIGVGRRDQASMSGSCRLSGWARWTLDDEEDEEEKGRGRE